MNFVFKSYKPVCVLF